MNEEKDKKSLHPDALKWIIIGLLGFAIIVLIFGIGIFIGGSKARFSYKWAESYHKNFGGPRGGLMGGFRGFPAGDFIEGHGSVGEIIKINGSELVIKGRDNVEKTIIINDKTVINKGRKTVKKDELKVGDFITVIGSPNDKGQIEAKLIRVF